MKIDLSNNENLRILCKYTGPLTGNLFNRFDMLRGIDLYAYEPHWQLIEEACSADEVAILIEYEIEDCRSSICGRGYIPKFINDYLKMRAGMHIEGDESYLNKLRTIKICRERINATMQVDAPWPAQSAYSQKRRQLRQQEIAAYAPTLYQSVKNPDDRQSHYTLYCQAVAAYGAEHGFTLDKAMSTRAIHIYSKPIYKDYVLATHVDKKNLVNALGKYVFVYGATEQWLGDLQMGFQLTHRDNKALKDFRQMKGYGPMHFFPLGPGYDQQSFYSLAELEFLIMAEFKMYGLIANELETALRNGLMEIEARQNAG